MLVGIDGGSVNPFRSLGPALLTGPTDVVWPFIIGPIFGAMLAVAVMWAQFGSITSLELQQAQGKGDA